jgi:hypothetical protein
MSRPRVRVLYLGHPVKGDVPGNVAKTKRWLKFLMDQLPGVAINCLWLPMIDCGNGANQEEIDRALRDDVEMARRCDGILLTGGVVSSGMAEERDGCNEEGGEVFDLTHLGSEPPTNPSDFDIDTITSTTSPVTLAQFCALDVEATLQNTEA